MTLIHLALLFSAISFFSYGIGCFVSDYMIREFTRYGIPQYRKLTGWLQLLGGLGIALGFWNTYVQIFSTVGLTLLMLLGVFTRILIKDSFIKTLPALSYCVLNAYLSYTLFQHL
ncbi:MAG: DoxX family protein [Flavobacteriaceae bacterium]